MSSFNHFLYTYGYVAIFVLTMLQASCIPIPSEVVIGLGGALANAAFDQSGHHQHLALFAVIVTAICGEMVGSMIAYTVGRTAGRGIVDRWGRYLLLSHHDLDRADAWFARRGPIAVLFGRMIPLVRAFISLVAGIGEMAIGKFVGFSVIGITVWCTALAFIGYNAAGTYESALKGFSWAGYLVAGAIVVVLVVFYVHRYRSMKAAGTLPSRHGQD